MEQIKWCKFSGGGRGCLVVVVAPVSQWWWSVSPRVFLAKIPFFLGGGAFSHYHGNHFAKFLAHVLSWVKTYHHAEFQRNPSTGLAGMMVQT